jgi:Zn-dependent membrane protease YugP
VDSSWHVYLRDILVIAAAAALIGVSVMAALVVWQLYRLAVEFRDEVKPILESVQETADTVRETAEFMGGRVVSPAVSAMGAAAGARTFVQLLRQFYKNADPRQK